MQSCQEKCRPDTDACVASKNVTCGSQRHHCSIAMISERYGHSNKSSQRAAGNKISARRNFPRKGV